MANRRNPRSIVITDPRAIRALAHPARLAIIEALRYGQELTATECAQVTGLSPSATSYHLKALQRWGMVEPGSPRDDARNRPWRSVAQTFEFRSEGAEGPNLPETALLSAMLDRSRTIAAEFLTHQSDEEPAWRDAVEVSNADYWLTPDEVRQVSRAMRTAVAPYEDRRDNNRPPDSRRVRVTHMVVPRR